jgi:RNA polymerase sigma factor (sigma-70 family)
LNSFQRNKLIEGIRNQDKAVLKKLYVDYFPFIKRFVLNNSGSEQDAKDVFQEGIIITYRKIKSGTFELSSSFKTYIYGVCRFVWIKQLSKNQEDFKNQHLFTEYEGIQDITVDEYEENEQYKLYQTHFKRLSQDCQKIMTLFLNKVPMKDIAEEMGIDSIQFAKRKKYKCKEQLVKYIKSDPNYTKW